MFRWDSCRASGILWLPACLHGILSAIFHSFPVVCEKLESHERCRVSLNIWSPGSHSYHQLSTLFWGIAVYFIYEPIKKVHVCTINVTSSNLARPRAAAIPCWHVLWLPITHSFCIDTFSFIWLFSNCFWHSIISAVPKGYWRLSVFDKVDLPLPRSKVSLQCCLCICLQNSEL